jgi:NADH-quinone oxidoreductase subunit J
MNSIFFIVLVFITIGAAVMVILSRNPVYSVLYLVLAFFSIAGFYLLLGAQFLALVQIIIYAGAIMVLFLFVVMLLNLREIQERGKALLRTLGIVTGGLILLLLILIINNLTAPTNPVSGMTTTKDLAEALFTTYLLPFEIASVLLLVAIIGAVALIKKRPA